MAINANGVVISGLDSELKILVFAQSAKVHTGINLGNSESILFSTRESKNGV